MILQVASDVFNKQTWGSLRWAEDRTTGEVDSQWTGPPRVPIVFPFLLQMLHYKIVTIRPVWDFGGTVGLGDEIRLGPHVTVIVGINDRAQFIVVERVSDQEGGA